MALADQTEIKFCRVCLAVDVKMYEMKEYRLSEMFQNITGITACNKTERVLHHVCWECAARLTAASAFRDKALLTDTLLKDVVHRNKRNIEQLRQHYSYLKSPLTVQIVFTSADIDCEDIPTESHSDETEKRKVYKRRRKRKSNEEGTVFDEEEPLVEFSIKTEVESDPFAENNINNRIKVENSETISQVIHFDDSFTPSKDDNEDEIRNTEELMNEKSEDIEMMAAPVTYGINLVEDNGETQPTIDVVNQVFDEPSSEDTGMNNRPNDDRDIVSEDDNVEENPVLDGIGNVSSSEEDVQSLAELVSVKKAKKQTRWKVGTSNKPKKLSDGEKQKIIALKEKGATLHETTALRYYNKTTEQWWPGGNGCDLRVIECITAWWQRYSQEDSDIAEDENDNESATPGVLVADCPPHVRLNLREAGFGHLLRDDPGDKNSGQKLSEHTAKWNSLKQLIVALKQAGINTSETAHLLGITRNTVRQWWTRWCNEGNLSERKRVVKKRKTTAQEDQLILDRVSQSQSIHTPTLAKEFGISASLVRSRLKAAGFTRKFRGPYIPLNEGRTKKVDEDLKQRILTMRQNGVPVTDIAMKFRVPRTTIYQWWRQWCKENKMETTDSNTNDSIEEEQALAEDAKSMETKDSNINDSFEEQALTEDAKNEIIEKTAKKLPTKKTLDSSVEETKETPQKSSTKKALRMKKPEEITKS